MHEPDPDAPVELLHNMHEFQAVNLQAWFADHDIEVHLVPSRFATSIYTPNMGRDIIVRQAELERAQQLLPEFEREMHAHQQYWSLQKHAPADPDDPETEDLNAQRPHLAISRRIERFPFASLYAGSSITLILLIIEPVAWHLAIVLGVAATAGLIAFNRRRSDG